MLKTTSMQGAKCVYVYHPGRRQTKAFTQRTKQKAFTIKPPLLLTPSPIHLQIPENCSAGADCMPMVISWEGTTEIQSGDVLIVEIDDSLLVPDDNRTNKGEQK